MPSSSEVYPHGKIRFFRLTTILHDDGKELLTRYFKTFYVGKTLDAFLNEPANRAKIDASFRSKVINHDQYRLLYPLVCTDVRLYDITLLVFLIRSLHPTVPVHDPVWKCPAPGDKSMEAAVSNLREVKNVLYSHIYELNLSETDFTGHCSYLQSLFETLANGIGDPGLTVDDVKDRIEDKIHASIDPDSENRLLNCLQSWRKFDNQEYLIERLDEQFAELKGEIQSLREAVCPVREVRSVGTCTAEDVENIPPSPPPQQQQPVSSSIDQCQTGVNHVHLHQFHTDVSSCSSLDSDGTVYEVPVTSQRISDSSVDTISDISETIKYNDAWTSTTSLEPKKTLPRRILSYVLPFLNQPRVPKQTPGHACQEASRKSVVKRHTRQRSSGTSRFSCMRHSTRYRHVSKINSERHDDLPLRCFLSGLVHLMNGLLVVVDSTHNTIQVFDQWRVPIDVYKCKYPIKNVCAFKNDKKVAITLFKNNSVALFEITRKDGVKYLETINVNCSSWLIDVKYRHGKLYTMCDNSEIHVHHFRSIPDDVIKFDIGVTPLSFDISITEGKTYLYILHSEGVICFTDNGKEIWERSFYEMGVNHELTYMCLHQDKLFITAWGTNRVIELTTHGGWVRDIGVGKLTHPWSLCVSITGEQVFVSQYSVVDQRPNTCELVVFR